MNGHLQIKKKHAKRAYVIKILKYGRIKTTDSSSKAYRSIVIVHERRHADLGKA